MSINMTVVLWLILLIMFVQMLPLGGKWTKPLLWGGLVLLTAVLVLTHILTLPCCR